MQNLNNNLGFDLYVASRLISQAYRDPLLELGLTYPQYLVMLVLWEDDAMTVSQIGEKLQLDSGTLTPLLKRLESVNLLHRIRSQKDERKVVIELTYPGKALESKAKEIPEKIREILNNWEEGELSDLSTRIKKLIQDINANK